MKFSVIPILASYVNKQGQCAILLQVIHNGMKAYPALDIKILPAQWKNNKVAGHPLKDQINKKIKEKKLEIESRLLDIGDKHLTAKELAAMFSGKIKHSLLFADFTNDYINEMKHKLSPGRIKHYRVIIGKVNAFNRNTLLTDINGTWLQQFENWLISQQLKSGTIKSKISIIKAIINAAYQKNIIEQFSFKGYRNIKVTADEPEFLTENELQSFFNVCRAIQKTNLKLSGYYFLLSCLTGLRISDAKHFSYNTHVRDNEIIVRTKKNNKIVTIPLYNELIEVLEYIQDKPLLISEQKVRTHIKELAALAGIKKHVKYHTSRHTATSRFLQKGLSQTEVAEIIGDTEAVTKIYSHIDKKTFNKKMLELMN